MSKLMSMLNADSRMDKGFLEKLDINYTVCYKQNENDIGWKGIWFEQDLTGHVLSLLMLQIILSFFISRFLYYVLRPLKQPKFVCDILTGIILGPSVISHKKEMKIFQPKTLLVSNTLSTMGGIYFIFVASVKMDKSRILLTTKKVWNISLTCFLVPCVISAFLFFYLRKYLTGITAPEADFLIYMSVVLSLSNYPVISHVLSELNMLSSELGELALSVVMLHAIIAGILATTASFAISGFTKGVITGQLCMCVLIIFIVLVVRPLILWIIRTTPEGHPVKGAYLRLILIAPLITGMLCDSFGATYFSGAQIMGLIIPAGPPLGSAVVEKCELVLSEILLPFFYIHLGLATDVHLIKDWQAVQVFLFILVAGCLGKVVGSLLTLLSSNIGLRNAFLLSFILNVKGVMEFTVILWWRLNKFVNDSYFTAFVFSHVAVTAIVVPLMQIVYKPEISLKSCSSFSNCLRALQSTPLIGELRVLCCIHCEDDVNGIISLLTASNPTENSTIRAYTLHLSELIGRAAPVLAPYKSQRKRSKSNSTDRIMGALSKYLKCPNISITTESLSIIAPYNTMHETICKLARDKYIPLIIVPFPESLELHGKRARLRNLNMNILKYAPCTVGIFIDRSSNMCQKKTRFSYSVLHFFFGGPDDREALSLVLRMSGHPGVNITMIRIDLRVDKEEYNQDERYLDECSINDFKTRNMGNACVVCREVVAKETMQVVNTIRSAGNDYDLVIVGKHQGHLLVLEKEMLPWVEYKELGVIGDVVASSDFCGGTMSVLVMHCADLNGISSTGTPSLDARSRFSFASSNFDRDNDVRAFIANQEKSVRFSTEV